MVAVGVLERQSRYRRTVVLLARRRVARRVARLVRVLSRFEFRNLAFLDVGRVVFADSSFETGRFGRRRRDRRPLAPIVSRRRVRHQFLGRFRGSVLVEEEFSAQVALVVRRVSARQAGRILFRISGHFMVEVHGYFERRLSLDQREGSMRAVREVFELVLAYRNFLEQGSVRFVSAVGVLSERHGDVVRSAVLRRSVNPEHGVRPDVGVAGRIRTSHDVHVHLARKRVHVHAVRGRLDFILRRGFQIDSVVFGNRLVRKSGLAFLRILFLRLFVLGRRLFFRRRLGLLDVLRVLFGRFLRLRFRFRLGFGFRLRLDDRRLVLVRVEFRLERLFRSERGRVSENQRRRKQSRQNLLASESHVPSFPFPFSVVFLSVATRPTCGHAGRVFPFHDVRRRSFRRFCNGHVCRTTSFRNVAERPFRNVFDIFRYGTNVVRPKTSKGIA